MTTNDEPWVPEIVISGGQTGADRGGLDAAIERELKVGGWCPKGRRAEDGRIPELYPMTEHASSAYPPRTRANIIAADATVVFCRSPAKGGSLWTLTECAIQEKPFLELDLNQKDEVLIWNLKQWLAIRTPRRLNVAGSRESREPGIQSRVKAILLAAWKG